MRAGTGVPHAICKAGAGSTNGAQTSQPRATPWVSSAERLSPERAAEFAVPFQGCWHFCFQPRALPWAGLFRGHWPEEAGRNRN